MLQALLQATLMLCNAMRANAATTQGTDVKASFGR